MSLICAICHDNLVTNPSQDITIVSARCGHLLHNSCLQEVVEWAKEKESRNKYINRCPHCRKNAGETGFFKIFPIFAKRGSSSGPSSMRHLDATIQELKSVFQRQSKPEESPRTSRTQTPTSDRSDEDEHEQYEQLLEARQQTMTMT